jgi:hypothetical protein
MFMHMNLWILGCPLSAGRNSRIREPLHCALSTKEYLRCKVIKLSNV